MAINILQAFNNPPPALDFVLPGLLAGTVGALVSPGGAGKSMFALELSILIATGKDLTGFTGGNEYKQGAVSLLATEDPAIALQHRLHALGGHLDQQQREQFAQNFLVEPVVGLGFDVADKDWRFYVESMAVGRRLLLIDTLRRFHNLDENSSSEMAYLLNTMENISQKTNCAIVFLHHTNKSAAINGLGDMQQASRGSSVLVDNIRWQAFMSNCTKDEAKKYNISDDRRGYFVRCGVSKQNYGQPITDTWLRRVEGGVLTEAFLTETSLTSSKKRVRDEA